MSTSLKVVSMAMACLASTRLRATARRSMVMGTISSSRLPETPGAGAGLAGAGAGLAAASVLGAILTSAMGASAAGSEAGLVFSSLGAAALAGASAFLGSAGAAAGLAGPFLSAGLP